ncbi:hypothetical protein [Ornithinibacillus californiensis]|nr:hypothetical protein [Ornithinibacillus californiensis]
MNNKHNKNSKAVKQNDKQRKESAKKDGFRYDYNDSSDFEK